MTLIILLFQVRRVENVQLVIVWYTNTGITTMMVVILVWVHRDTAVSKVHEIFGRYVVPVLQTVHWAKREPLIENMVLAIEVTQTIRVIQQAVLWCDVVAWVKRVCLCFVLNIRQILLAHLVNSDKAILTIRKIHNNSKKKIFTQMGGKKII